MQAAAAEKIQQLQLLEQTLQTISMQKQQSQFQLAETDNAIKELASISQTPYKIIGNFMIQTNKKDLEKELLEKKEILELRLKTLAKQEKISQEKAGEIQKEVMGNLS